MLIQELTAEHIYLACGYTDMRKSIEGLAALVVSRFHLDPHQPALFLFCGRCKDRIKGLLWDEMGFLLLYERTTRILPEIADGQLNLFNEAEVEAKKNAPEPCIEVPAHQRRKKQKDHTAELLAKFPHEECLITLPEEERVCKRCGTALTSMGKEKIRTEIEFIPAKVKVIDYYRESFQCLAYRKEAHPIRLYEYQPGRSGSYAKDFLKGFNGILQTDGYTGYQKVPCHAHALCWAHARRYFVEAIPPDLPKEDLLGSICKEAIERINELFAIDKGLAELTKEEREEQRL